MPFLSIYMYLQCKRVLAVPVYLCVCHQHQFTCLLNTSRRWILYTCTLAATIRVWACPLPIHWKCQSGEHWTVVSCSSFETGALRGSWKALYKWISRCVCTDNDTCVICAFLVVQYKFHTCHDNVVNRSTNKHTMTVMLIVVDYPKHDFNLRRWW